MIRNTASFKEIVEVDVQEERQGNISIISITGSIDALTAEDLVSVLDQSITDDYTRIIGDLSGVDYMSSAGLRAILKTLKASRAAAGDLRLAAPTEGVRSLLDMSGFASIVQIYDDVDAAVKSFEGE
jgi:anti-anti-sigma factor